MKEQAGGVTLNNSAVVEKMCNEWQEEEKTGTWCKEKNVRANEKQMQVVDMIARRVKEEAHDMESDGPGASDPLRALIYGGPGVGKSFVIHATRRLFDK